MPPLPSLAEAPAVRVVDGGILAGTGSHTSDSTRATLVSLFSDPLIAEEADTQALGTLEVRP